MAPVSNSITDIGVEWTSVIDMSSNELHHSTFTNWRTEREEKLRDKPPRGESDF